MRGRPPKAEGEAKKLYIGVKLTPAERDIFDRVLALRNEELRRLTGEEFSLTASELMRRLFMREAERLGLRPAAGESRPPPPPEPEPPAPARSPSKASPKAKAHTKASKAPPAKLEPGKGRRR